MADLTAEQVVEWLAANGFAREAEVVAVQAPPPPAAPAPVEKPKKAAK